MVHLTEAITNRTVVRGLTDLARVIDDVPKEESASTPARVGVRVGWATDQVVAVLGEATEALSPTEVQARIYARTGQQAKYSTVLRALRDGHWAKSGRIVSDAPARYRLA